MTRRQLIQMIFKTGIALPFVNFSSISKLSAEEPLLSLDYTLPKVEDRVVVLIRMFGGNDGLNCLVPFNNDLYYKIRRENAVIPVSIDPKVVLKINGTDTTAFHPAWREFQELYNEEKLAIIQNVGYPNQDLSHFRSTDIWLSASQSDVFEQSGWMGRYLEKKYPNFTDNIPDHPPAIEYGTSVSRILLGKNNPMGFAYLGDRFVPENPSGESVKISRSRTEQNFIRKIQEQSHNFLKTLTTLEEKNVKNLVEYPADNHVAVHLSHTARLIASGLKTNIYAVNTENMFDNHESLLDYQNTALTIISQAVGAFQRDLEKLGISERVITVLYSEFGRRVAPNGSGTDHGAAGPLFVLGKNVKGGFYGNDPDLSDLDINGNLKYNIDFRQVYATILSSWFEVPVNDIFPDILSFFSERIPFLKTNENNSRSISIYPNPCYNSILVTIGFNNISEINIYSINAIEQQIKTSYLNSYGINIDVSNLVPGTYFIKAKADSNNYFGKFIKL